MAVPTWDGWITFPAAKRRLRIGRDAFNNLLAEGNLTYRESMGGSYPLVLASDVDALAEASTRRAKGGGVCV